MRHGRYRPIALAAIVAASLAVAGCFQDSAPKGGGRLVRVSEKDFTIHAPLAVRAGEVDFDVRNGGPVAHELIVALRQRPLPLRSDGSTVDEEGLERGAVGALEPGDRARSATSTSSAARPYELICNMAGHFLGGMHLRLVVTMRRRGETTFRPFAARGRRAMVAILFTFALCSAVSVSISIWATTRVKHQATIVQIAARQRSLAERYVGEVLLAKRGVAVDPAKTAELMRASADAL